MARILIGNIKGPQGPKGEQGIQGPTGPVGPQGPLPPLANNGTTEEVGKAALDAAYGKVLRDDVDQLNRDIVAALPNKVLKGGTISGKKDGIYTILNPTDGWDSGYYFVISSVGATIALNLNTSKMKYRSGGDWVNLAN